MMKKLWTCLERQHWTAGTKYRAAFLFFGILAGLLGWAVWQFVGVRLRMTQDGQFCLIGYPIVLSWCVVFFYACRHDFHDGPRWNE